MGREEGLGSQLVEEAILEPAYKKKEEGPGQPQVTESEALRGYPPCSRGTVRGPWDQQRRLCWQKMQTSIY